MVASIRKREFKHGPKFTRFGYAMKKNEYFNLIRLQSCY